MNRGNRRAFTVAEMLALLATIAAIWWLVTPDDGHSQMKGYPRRRPLAEKLQDGCVVIESYPPRGKLYLDGRYTNKRANIDVLDEVPMGTHTIRVELPGYEPAQIKVFVPGKKVLRPPVVVLQKSKP